jgi:DNA-binding NarL/FixJ family response regulator
MNTEGAGYHAEPIPQVLVLARDVQTLLDLRRTLSPLRVDVATAQTVAGAFELAARCRPAVAIADVELGGPATDLRFVETLRARWSTSIILLTERRDAQTLTAIATTGASGVVRKPVDARQLELTLRVAIERRMLGENGAAAPVHERKGGPPLSAFEDALHRIAAEIERLGLGERRPTGESALVSGLRPREQQVVRLLLQHYRVPAIASELSISPQTVRNHLKHVFRRVGVHSQQELLARLR